MKTMTIAALALLAAGPVHAQTTGSRTPSSTSGGQGVTDTFTMVADLQGIYDEISQATLQFASESDIDLFHDVIYAPDFVFVDGNGHSDTWKEVRERAVRALSEPYPDSIVQPIQKMTPTAAGVTTLVNLTIVRTVIDQAGRYGKPGLSHTLTETTAFRDAWTHGPEGWKLKSRQQVGKPKVLVDEPEF